MLVPHVSLEVELFELCEPAEAEEADNLPAQIVAQVPLGPDTLEGSAVAHAVRNHLRRGQRWLLRRSNYQSLTHLVMYYIPHK